MILPNYEQPEPIRWREGEAGHIPHCTAQKSGRQYIFDVAAHADFAKLNTEERWRLVSYDAEEAGATFIVVVNVSEKPPEEAEIRRLRITAKVMGATR
jgi:hypothetical protein